MIKFFFLISLLILVSCKEADKSTLEFYEIKSENFSSFVNQKEIPTAPNLSIDRSIINNEYPIEIALYKESKFYYNLPNLGDGTGTWKLENGVVKLYAKRSLFDMYIEIQAKDESVSNVIIKFRDRFGPKVLNTIKQNFE